ncbi:hypothetical protein GALL_297390 [mine drainage metagenome]|uniref:Uncharacterized protein n=1 Tax=mine drainage metagenome TaxID=410659 RepID=A0A1J5QYP5_9ZZZZ
MALMGSNATAQLLDVDRSTAEDIIRSGLAGPAYALGDRLAAESSNVERLAQIQYLSPDDPSLPPALVVKVKPAEEDKNGTPDRTWMGWHAQLTPTERADGVRGWWPVRDVEAWIGELLVVTLGGFVVETWRIKGIETFGGRLHRFEVSTPATNDTAAARYIGQRMAPVRGGVTLRLPLA